MLFFRLGVIIFFRFMRWLLVGGRSSSDSDGLSREEFSLSLPYLLASSDKNLWASRCEIDIVPPQMFIDSYHSSLSLETLSLVFYSSKKSNGDLSPLSFFSIEKRANASNQLLCVCAHSFSHRTSTREREQNNTWAAFELTCVHSTRTYRLPVRLSSMHWLSRLNSRRK